MNLRPWALALRNWQTLLFKKYLTTPLIDFLAVVSTGAGKTVGALRILHYLLATGVIKRVVIVVPSRNLIKQWIKDAHALGIELTGLKNDDGLEPTDFHGCIVTYGGLAANPEVHRMRCRDCPTAVVFDEVHHLGEQSAWGLAAVTAFAEAARRIHLSGTPFRSKPDVIPFVRYKDDLDKTGCCTCDPDFTFTYGEAVGAKICRKVEFPDYSGSAQWLSRGKEFFAATDTDVPESQRNNRLRTLCNPEFTFCKVLIRAAIKRLNEVRQSRPNAGGIVFCADARHAYAISEFFVHETGERPTLILSEVDGTDEKLEAYRNGTSAWIICVRMVAEGTDLKRLRVGVLLNAVTAPLLFEQMMGRLVRTLPGQEEDVSYLFMPNDSELLAHAERVWKSVLLHTVEPQIDVDPPPPEPGGGGIKTPAYVPLDTHSAAFAGTTASGTRHLASVVEEGRRIATVELHITSLLSDEEYVNIARKWNADRSQAKGDNGSPPPGTPSEASPQGELFTSDPGVSLDQQLKDLKTTYNKHVRHLGKAMTSAIKAESFNEMNVYEIVGSLVKKRAGICKNGREPGIAEVQKMVQAATKLLQEGLNQKTQAHAAEFLKKMYLELTGN